jgi:putative peptidoglycan lipid II flippase
MLAVSVVIFIFAEPLIHYVVAPKLAGQQLQDAVVIMRFIALNPLLFTLSGILTSVQQTLGRFFFYAIAPLFYNASIIVSIYVFHNTAFGLKGLGIGALVGGILQLAVVCTGLIGTKFKWHPHIMWHSADFRTVLRQLPPRSLDQGIDQIQSIVETNLANRLGQGYVSYYSNAYTLQTAPILLIGTAISTAAFPRLAARLSQNRPDLFRKDFLEILRFMVWISIPVVIVGFFGRGYLAHLIFSQNSSQIALIFGYLSVAIFFRIIYTIMSRWFYARKDTKTPLFVSIFTIGFNIILAINLANPSNYGVAGLAMSVSIAAAVEVFILSTIMVIRDRGLLNKVFWGGLARIISVSGFSVVAGYITAAILPLGAEDRGIFTLGTKLMIIALVTFSVHIIISGLFGLDESRPTLMAIKRLALKPIRV